MPMNVIHFSILCELYHQTAINNLLGGVVCVLNRIVNKSEIKSTIKIYFDVVLAYTLQIVWIAKQF